MFMEFWHSHKLDCKLRNTTPKNKTLHKPKIGKKTWISGSKELHFIIPWSLLRRPGWADFVSSVPSRCSGSGPRFPQSFLGRHRSSRSFFSLLNRSCSIFCIYFDPSAYSWWFYCNVFFKFIIYLIVYNHDEVAWNIAWNTPPNGE